jgi:hypothetical protein
MENVEMRTRRFLNVIIGLLATLGVIGGSIGIVETAEAEGLGGRSFQVKVKQISGARPPAEPPAPMPPGPNCYTFEADGTWIDPLFLGPNLPVFPGTWVQHTEGAITRYTAMAESPEFPFLPALVLVQNGHVTPTFSKGQLRLKAFSTVFIGGQAVAEFVSTGYEVDGCP